jgi:hypothetical protein
VEHLTNLRTSASARHEAIRMAAEVTIEEHEDFDFIDSLPVTETNFGGFLRWHPRSGTANGSPLVKYVGKLWSPLFTLQDSCGPSPKLMLVAYEVTRPHICIQFLNFEPQNPALATMMLLGSLGHCRDLQSQICFRLARTPRMQKTNEKPSMAFVRAYAKFAKGTIKSLIIFPGNDFLAMSILRFLSYVGASLQISMIPFLSEADFDSWCETTSFATNGTLSLDSPQLSELAKAVSRLEAQYPQDVVDTTPLKGPYPSTNRPGPASENIASFQNSQEELKPLTSLQGSSLYLFKIEEVDEECAISD